MKYLIIAPHLTSDLPDDTYHITSADKAERLITNLDKFAIEAAIIQNTSQSERMVSQLRDNCPLLSIWRVHS